MLQGKWGDILQNTYSAEIQTLRAASINQICITPNPDPNLTGQATSLVSKLP